MPLERQRTHVGMKAALLDSVRRGWDAARWFPELLCSSRLGLASSNSHPDLASILTPWDLGDFNAKRISMGGSASNWIVDTREGKYILRSAGEPRPYVEFQVQVMDCLAQSEFPYQTPQLVSTETSCQHEYQNEAWLLYPFIKGGPARVIATIAEADAVGRLVGHYHQATIRVKHDRLADFAVDLFQVEDTCSLFLEKTAAMMSRKRLRKSETLWLRLADSVLAAYAAIPSAAQLSIQQMELIPVYNDWYPDNILMQDRRIIGLIDFDSVVAGPYLLDLQNALLYAAGTRTGFQADRIRAFTAGYLSVRPLPPADLRLVSPLMIDRSMFLIARAMRDGWPEAVPWKDGLIEFVLGNLTWIVVRQEEFTEHLLAGASVEMRDDGQHQA